MTIRSFIAVNLAVDTIRKVTVFQEKLSAQLKRAGCRVSWVRPSNMHLTLRFLGDIDESLPDGIERVLARKLQRLPAIPAQTAGVGVFPAEGRPRVIWVGVENAEDRLRSLQAEVEAGMRDLGFAPEGRPWSPHLTLGRVQSEPPDAIRGALAELGTPDFGASEIRHVVVYQSDLKPTGAEYTALRRIPLEGGPKPQTARPSMPAPSAEPAAAEPAEGPEPPNHQPSPEER